MDKYKEWIDNWLTTNIPDGSCQRASHQMKEAFPELIIKSGHVFCSTGRRQHWWLETTDGDIVDPTASQFVLLFDYEEYQDGAELRCGKCMNCGEGIYANSIKEAQEKSGAVVCSPQCSNELVEYLDGV